MTFSCYLVDSCMVLAFKILTQQFRLLVFSLRWPELYFKVRKILGMVEGEQSEGYLVDTQNTFLYLVRCQWRAGRVCRRSEAEIALWMTRCLWRLVSPATEKWHFRADFVTWYLSLLRWCSTECYFSFLTGGFNKQRCPICPSL